MWPFKSKITEQPQQEVSKSAGMMQNLDSPIKEHFTIPFKQKGEKRFNSESLLLMYENISQVNSVVNYIAAKGADIPFKHVRYLGNGKTKDLGETEVLKSLQSPNKKVSQNAFIQDIITQFIIQGNTPILKKYTPGFTYPTGYEVLHAPSVYQIPLNSIDQYGTPSMSVACYDNPIIKIKQELENGSLKPLKIEEVIYIKDSNPRKKGKDYYYGASRLYAAIRTIKVLDNMYDTINTILGGKGALGFLSRDTKAGEIDPKQWLDVVDEVERKINNDYGTTGGKKAIMATYANMKWNRMDSPISEFMPVELTAQEFAQLCNQMGGMPDVLLNSKGNSTYNNVQLAEKAFYINVVMPILSNIYNTISIDLGISKTNEWIVPDFSQVESLQKNNQDLVKFALDAKIITKNEALSMVGLPEKNIESFNEIEEDGIQDKSTGQPNT